MMKRLLLPLLLLTAHVALADDVPSEPRSWTQVRLPSGAVRPEPPRPREEPTRPHVVLQSSRPSMQRAAAEAPSLDAAAPAAPTASIPSALRFDRGTTFRPSATPAGPSPSRAPPLA